MDEFESKYFDDIDEVAADEQDFKDVKDALLFAIEINHSMLEIAPTTSKSSARIALESAYETITNRILVNAGDISGIMLFGVNPTDNDDERYPACRMIMPLQTPDSKSVKNLKWILEDEKKFEETCSPADSVKVSMADVFFLANQQFNIHATKYPSKRLVLITDNDNPHDDKIRLAALTRANDLVQSRVMIIPAFLTSDRKPFNTKLFYDEIEYRISYNQDSSLEKIYPRPVNQLSLKDEIKSHRNMRRSLFKTCIELAPGLVFGVKGFLLYCRQKPSRSHYVYTGGEMPVLVNHTTKIVTQDSLKELEPDQVKRTYKIGDSFIPLKPKQIAELKYFDDPIIRIIGFKPISVIEPWMNVTHSIFLYPTESDYVGSVRMFTSFYKSLLKMNKIAIAWAVLRKNASPIICALYPSPEETRNINGVNIQTGPPGLHLIRLPFADDIRQRPNSMSVKASDSLVDSFTNIIKTLTMPKGYESSRYHNPRLQWFYMLLQSTALDEELPKIPIDTTIPKYNSINTKAGSFISDFNQKLNSEYDSITRYKRIGDDEEIQGIKRSKTNESVLLDADIYRALEDGGITKFTVKQLSEFTKSKGITTETKKKQDYITAIERSMAKK